MLIDKPRVKFKIKVIKSAIRGERRIINAQRQQIGGVLKEILVFGNYYIFKYARIVSIYPARRGFFFSSPIV
jgi:hypothetical protein